MAALGSACPFVAAGGRAFTPDHDPSLAFEKRTSDMAVNGSSCSTLTITMHASCLPDPQPLLCSACELCAGRRGFTICG